MVNISADERVELQAQLSDWASKRVTWDGAIHLTLGHAAQHFANHKDGLANAMRDLADEFKLQRDACAAITPRCVRVLRDAPEHTETRFIANELRLVLSELHRYQIHGITYPPLRLT